MVNYLYMRQVEIANYGKGCLPINTSFAFDADCKFLTSFYWIKLVSAASPAYNFAWGRYPQSSHSSLWLMIKDLDVI